jgi:hypothetical protein
MSPHTGDGRHYWIFTTWQWAVLGAYLIAVVLSGVVGFLADRALDNTVRIDKAICAQIIYLDRPRLRDDPATVQLVTDLRELEETCPAPERTALK